jgi:hypothetical protein
LGSYQAGALNASIGSQGHAGLAPTRGAELGMGSSNQLDSNQHALGTHAIFTKNLETDQIKHIEDFLEGIESVRQDVLRPTNLDPRRDEDLIVISLLKELTLRYFAPQPDLSNNVGNVLKSKISTQDFIVQLATIRFKEKNTDMILIMLKQLSDILLEVVLNPNSTTPQLNLMKSAKSSINVVLFLVKGFFQQVRTMKSIYCEDSSGGDASGILSQDCQKMIRPLVSVTVELCLPDQLKLMPAPPMAPAFQFMPVTKLAVPDANTAIPQALLSHNGGFNLNPNYLAELDQPMYNPSLDHSTNFFDKNFYLQKSSAQQLKRLSFEFPNPNSLRSEQQFIGHNEMEGALKDSGQNMNKFVSNLLKKRHED